MSLDPYAVLLAFALVAARMLPIVELVPVFSGPWVPRSVRFAVALGLTGLLVPTAIPPVMWAAAPGPVEAVALLVRELLIGVGLGFLTSLVFEAARMAGATVDRVASMSSDGDGPTARLYLIIAVVLFFGLGGGPMWVFALGRSYVVLPLDAGFGVFDGLAVAHLAADAIGLGVLLALPVLGVGLLAEICLAAAARMSGVVAGAVPASTRTLVAVAAVALSVGVFAEELSGQVLKSVAELPSALEVIYVQ